MVDSKGCTHYAHQQIAFNSSRSSTQTTPCTLWCLQLVCFVGLDNLRSRTALHPQSAKSFEPRSTSTVMTTHTALQLLVRAQGV